MRFPFPRILPILTVLALAATLAPRGFAGDVAPIELRRIDPDATPYGTFQSFNQKVASTSCGVFFTYLKSRDEPFLRQQWRLMRCRPGESEFGIVHEAVHATNPPCVETDEAGNVFVGHTDFKENQALFLRFAPERDFRDPTTRAVPGVGGGKFSMVWDPRRRRLHYASGDGTFLTLNADLELLARRALLAPGAQAVLQYPHLALGADGSLHLAWTTSVRDRWHYWSIHHLVSTDGGDRWRPAAAAGSALPIPADDPARTDEITTPEEHGLQTWLAGFLVRRREAHFVYLASRHIDDVAGFYRYLDDARPRHKVLALETGAVESRSGLGEGMSGSCGLDGFLVQDADSLYYVSSGRGRIACSRSEDGGTTWRIVARSEAGAALVFPYAVGGARQPTSEGFVVGTFTDRLEGPTQATGRASVWFFRIPVRK